MSSGYIEDHTGTPKAVQAKRLRKTIRVAAGRRGTGAPTDVYAT